jgi:hypothetical protein
METSPLGHSNGFFPVLRHLNFQKPTSQQGEKKTREKITKSM